MSYWCSNPSRNDEGLVANIYKVLSEKYIQFQILQLSYFIILPLHSKCQERKSHMAAHTTMGYLEYG